MRRAAVALLAAIAIPAAGEDRAIPSDRLRSGSEFMSEDLRALQKDDFANPAMLAVDKGAVLWRRPEGTAAKSCESCHGEASASMKGVAARYPAIDSASRRLLNIESRILQCRGERQGAVPFKYESEELLALTAYVAYQSRGMPLEVRITGDAHPHFEAGRKLYYRRSGQMNLACAHCHEQNWGRVLFSERISQGHPNAYPIYRLDWQGMGSLERRLKSCFGNARAEVPAYGAPELIDLELFLAWRAQGLAIESPGVRR